MTGGNQYIQANTNGTLHSASQPTLSPLNRGFLYGDAVYEVWRSYDKGIFAWEEHWARLHSSARSIHLEIPWTADYIRDQVCRTAAEFRKHSLYRDDIYIRLQIYRGEGAIGLDTALSSEPGFVILIKPVPGISPEVRNHGNRLIIARSIRRNPVQSLDPAWKTGNYLNNIMGLREARDRKADDVLFLNMAGELTEASTSNVAFIQGDRWITPSLGSGILAGITRATIIATVAKSAGLTVKERSVSPNEINHFDEAMLLSTTKDVQPVGRIDDFVYRVDAAAKLWRLKAVFEDHARGASAKRPELKV